MKFLKRFPSAIASFCRSTDLFLFFSVMAAGIYGFFLVYSVAVTSGTGRQGYLMQLICLVFGLLFALILSRIDYEFLATIWPLPEGAALLLVLLTFTPLGVNVPGTDDTAWLSVPLGPYSLSLQPSELMKIAFILTFSKHLSLVRDHINRPLTLLLLGAHGLLPIALVFLQGDDGTACIFICIFVGMLFAAGLNPLYLLAGMISVAGMIPLLWDKLSEDKKARFLCVIFVDQYAETTGWQQRLALSAMGSGKLWGVGYLQGGDHQLYARNNDMIFTVAGEELGFVGALLVLLVLSLILIAILRNALRAKNPLGMFLCIGMLCLIGFQSAINIGMNVRLLPILGITFPFFSAGGSSLATLLLGVGLVLSVHHFSREDQRKTLYKQME